MGKLNIEVGERFGKLTILFEIPCPDSGKRQARKFKCLCDCGREVVKDRLQLRRTPRCPYCSSQQTSVVSYNNEEWRDIPGYEGFYQVSNLARVKSLGRSFEHPTGARAVPCKVLKQCLGATGYLVVNLRKNGKTKQLKVHRLIAIAFIPNPTNKPFIDHINGIRTDNRIENLRWCTKEENDTFPLAIENKRIAMSNPSRISKIRNRKSSRPIVQMLNGEIIGVYCSKREAEKILGRAIHNTSKADYFKAVGFEWCYFDALLMAEYGRRKNL